jgi:hypothetical protein
MHYCLLELVIVTNGIGCRFYTDLRAENRMDDEPFFIFNVLNHDQKHIENLKFFHRDRDVQEMSASFGDAASRVLISSISDLDSLSNLILKCYETEASKRTG